MTLVPHSVRRGLVAVAAVAVLGGAAVGIAAAQAQPAAPANNGQAQSGYQKFIDALAKRLNTTSANLETAIGQARADAGLPGGGPGFPGAGPRRGGGPGRGGFGVELNAAAT
ncbi:MAG: hypothetical protein LC797_09685, partial [Chloroflexi bacterium]|nr:hypothetical protein [Chloroflexota bacterium]